MRTVLIIEDDISILDGLKDNLEFEGYRVYKEANGKRGLQLALNKDIGLVLLDLMLPGMSGYEICRRLKKEKPGLPIIMLTARGSEMDKVSGLDTGADDYITKPFSLPELLARIRAAFRRTSEEPPVPEYFSFGDIRLDFVKLQAYAKGKEITLSAKEYAIMEHFIRHEGEAIHRHDLLNEVWGYEAMPTTRTVDNFIMNLRKKLEENPSDPKHIIGVRGVGYRFISLNE